MVGFAADAASYIPGFNPAGTATKIVVSLKKVYSAIENTIKRLGSKAPKLRELYDIIVDIYPSLDGDFSAVIGKITSIFESTKKLAHKTKDQFNQLYEFIEKPLLPGETGSIEIRFKKLADEKDLVGPSAKGPRELPGTTLTSGPLFDTSTLFRGSHGNAGLVPKEIGEILTGRSYTSFRAFRNEFWKTISKSKYAEEFSAANRELMASGKAPFAVQDQWLGARSKYELHHIQPIGRGGSVYDLSNLMIVTPRFHNDVLDRRYHYGNTAD